MISGRALRQSVLAGRKKDKQPGYESDIWQLRKDIWQGTLTGRKKDKQPGYELGILKLNMISGRALRKAVSAEERKTSSQAMSQTSSNLDRISGRALRQAERKTSSQTMS